LVVEEKKEIESEKRRCHRMKRNDELQRR